MEEKYQIGQEFTLNKDASFYNTEEELIDVSKGDVFCINDIIEGSNCIMWHMVLFGFSNIEVRLSETELDELIE